MNKTMRTSLLASLLGLSLVGLAGCNTVEGVGKDVQEVGEEIEEEAEDAKD